MTLKTELGATLKTLELPKLSDDVVEDKDNAKTSATANVSKPPANTNRRRSLTDVDLSDLAGRDMARDSPSASVSRSIEDVLLYGAKNSEIGNVERTSGDGRKRSKSKAKRRNSFAATTAAMQSRMQPKKEAKTQVTMMNAIKVNTLSLDLP